jgi:hypothetical protein
MKNLTITAAAAAVLAAAFVALAAPALAAPTGAGSAQDTISQLEATGNRVIVHRDSSVPLDQAAVVSITRGPVMRQAVPNSTPNGDNTRSTISQDVYVTVR